MARLNSSESPELFQSVQRSYLVSDRMNQIILDHLDRRAWRAPLPGGRGRTIAAIFSHVYNVRHKWLRLSAPHLKPPPKLHRAHCTVEQTKQSLAKSAALCSEMLAEALAPRSRIKKFHRDGWARSWTPNAAMFAYMLTHDAHHRGQVCLLAHQLGYPLPKKAAQEIWCWEQLWKECGFGQLE